MAKAEKITVELSPQDRRLLQQIRDALVKAGIPEADLGQAAAGVRRLVETPTVFSDDTAYWESEAADLHDWNTRADRRPVPMPEPPEKPSTGLLRPL